MTAKTVKRPVGRPIGWRKVGAKRSLLVVRMTPKMRAWLRRLAHREWTSESAIVRQMLENRMKRAR